MGFSSNKDLIDELGAGKKLFSSFRKITGVAGMVAGSWNDWSMTTGNPRINVYPGSILTSTKLYYKNAGNIWHGPNVSPDTKHLTGAAGYCTSGGHLTGILCDYLMFYPLIDMDTSDLQEFDNIITIPRYTDGVGVRAMIVVTADTGPDTVSLNISYTNSAGVSGRTLPVRVDVFPNATSPRIVYSGANANNYGPFLPLADGDKGILNVQSLQLSAGTGGGWAALVLVKPLATFFSSSTNTVFNEKCFLRDSPSLPRIKDEAFLNYVGFGNAAFSVGFNFSGIHNFIWG